MDNIENVPPPSKTDVNNDEDMEVETYEPPGGLLELAMIGLYK